MVRIGRTSHPVHTPYKPFWREHREGRIHATTTPQTRLGTSHTRQRIASAAARQSKLVVHNAHNITAKDSATLTSAATGQQRNRKPVPERPRKREKHTSAQCMLTSATQWCGQCDGTWDQSHTLIALTTPLSLALAVDVANVAITETATCCRCIVAATGDARIPRRRHAPCRCSVLFPLQWAIAMACASVAEKGAQAFDTARPIGAAHSACIGTCMQDTACAVGEQREGHAVAGSARKALGLAVGGITADSTARHGTST